MSLYMQAQLFEEDDQLQAKQQQLREQHMQALRQEHSTKKQVQETIQTQVWPSYSQCMQIAFWH